MNTKNPAAAKTLSASSAATWMERLRAKASSYRSAADLSRATRTTLLDRRTAPDPADRLLLRACLDQLSAAVPARDASSLADRLEAISKQVAARWTKRGVATLNFMAAPVHGCYYLSTDSFYVEINIDGNSGRIVEAKVHHIDSNNQQSSVPKNCPEIISCLTKGDFAKFIDHLEGLMAIYDMPNASAQDKTRGWNSLSVIEADIQRIDNLSRYHDNGDLASAINFNPLGCVQPRAGGLPMKLTYFISPHERVEVSTKSFRTLSTTLINEENLGVSATIGIERSEQPRLLPIMSLISADGKEIPMTPSNSTLLPAGFVLQLDSEMPLEVAMYREIVAITGIDFVDSSVRTTAPLLQLIARHASKGALDSANNRGLFVTLPDQSHCYFLTDHNSLSGYMVKKIPFNHPSHVPRILALLRKQAIFNAIISSCVRLSGIQDLEKSILFEVSSMDLEHLCVTLEMSQDKGMASFELDFSDLRNVQSSMHKISTDGSIDAGQGAALAKAVFERSLSLPLTMRALTTQLMRRPKDPDPDPNDFNNAYPFDSSNLDNGNVMTPMDMDFKSGSGLSAPIVKTERMDFDMNNGGNQDHLNANRPQDAALIPGAEKSKITPNSSTIPQIKVTKETTGTAKTVQADKPKSSSNKTVNFNNDHINHLEIKALKSKPSSSTSKSGLSSSKSNKAVDIKPSVSITPVSSADAAMMNLKKPTGIEIIPLGDKLPKESSNKETTLLKEIKRSFSEDDKRRFDKKTDAKKRKRDHYLSSKNDEKKSRPSSSSKESGIEIIKYDKSKESSAENKSSAMKSPQQSLKLTIKSTSSSKHRSSDYHHKSKHSSSSTSSSSSKHSSSSSAKRSSPSLSQMMKHSSSKSSSSSKSKEKERQQQRDKDRIEEVKRLLGGNKLDTTFQIPKRTKPEEKKQATSTTSNSKSLPPPSSGSNASPRYPGSISPPDISPKYSGSSSSASSSTTGTPRKPTSPPPILSPSNKNSITSGQPPMTSSSSSAAVATFMSLPSSGGANAQSPPLLAAFDKGCDKDLNNVSSTGLSK